MRARTEGSAIRGGSPCAARVVATSALTTSNVMLEFGWTAKLQTPARPAWTIGARRGR
jgi:hypothetical protein